LISKKRIQNLWSILFSHCDLSIFWKVGT